MKLDLYQYLQATSSKAVTTNQTAFRSAIFTRRAVILSFQLIPAKWNEIMSLIQWIDMDLMMQASAFLHRSKSIVFKKAYS